MWPGFIWPSEKLDAITWSWMLSPLAVAAGQVVVRVYHPPVTGGFHQGIAGHDFAIGDDVQFKGRGIDNQVVGG